MREIQKIQPHITPEQLKQFFIIKHCVIDNPYIPHMPTDKQLRFLKLLDEEEALYGGSAGGGKAQPITEPVMTPFGEKCIGDLTVGDSVLNPDGTVSKVIIAHPHSIQRCFKISFHDGTFTYCNEQHLWKSWRSRRGTKKNNVRTFGEDGAKICTTETLIKWLEKSKDTGTNAPLIPISYEVPFNVTLKRKSEIDPYLLGILLGDGSIPAISETSQSIRITSEDIEHMTSELNFLGLNYGIDSKDGTNAKSFRMRGESASWLKKELNRLKLDGKKSDTKFIPREFKLSSIPNRYHLIQGLMDTDGYVDERGQIYYCTVSKQLADDIAFVLRSLGAVVTIYEKETGFKRAYELYIKHRNPEKLFRLERKKERTLNAQPDLMFKRIVNIELESDCVMRCITVDNPNGLYLTRDFIVTHNSDSLLMAALMFVDVPGYNALILRQTYKDLALPGAIMDRSKEWLGKHTELHWDEKEKKWTFPSGATLSFGYLFGPNDKYNYQSANFHFIGFDELTQFREADYLYLFSRLRKGSDDQLPLRLRSASNPGGKGHEWVKERFIDGGVTFIPARLSDNPYLNIDEYMNALSKLDPVTREQLLNGDWDVVVTGNMFKPQWFDIIEEAPRNGQDVRFWDLAATADTGQNDPDYCSGLLLSRISANRYVVKDLVRFRADPGETQDIIVATAKRDGFQVSIVIEQEGGAAAKLYIETLRKQILQGKYHVVESKPDKSKIVRAQAVSAAASRKEISLVRAEWNKAFLSELSRFPEVEHDDQTDSFSGSYNWLNQKSNVTRERIPIRKPLKPGSGLSS